MQKVEFQLLDVATWRTPSGYEPKLSGAEKRDLLEKSRRIIGKVMPVKPSSLRKRGNHLLVVLANNQPITALFYKQWVNDITGKPYASFHIASSAKKAATLNYARARGKTPARALFSWMQHGVGRKTTLCLRGLTPDGLNFIRKLVRDRILEHTATGSTEEYKFLTKPRRKTKKRRTAQRPKIVRRR